MRGLVCVAQVHLMKNCHSYESVIEQIQFSHVIGQCFTSVSILESVNKQIIRIPKQESAKAILKDLAQW